MDNYIVSARKYRPATFDTVVGQSSLTTTLKNAIRNGKLAHAYLFCGPRGVGKTTCARIFAKTINCLSPKENGEACNECESCKAFNEQRSYNIHELDAASNNSVDDIRQLIEQVRITPQIGKYKVFIIDEVHMLSTAAFNAFLKTLEEPPHHAIFILATTEKHKLLPTILSRCQIYDFSRMGVDDIVAHLANVAAKEGVTCEPAALNVIAQKADGGMRDALSIFDQVASFCQGNITYQQTIKNLNVLDSEYYFRLTDNFLACGNGDPKAPKVDQKIVTDSITSCILTLNEILSKGFDGQHFIGGLASHLRNLLVSRDAQTVKLIEASDDIRQKYQQQAQKCSPRFLFSAMRLCNDCDLQYKQSQNKRLLVELTLIEIAQVAQGEDVPSSGRRPKKILKPIFAGVAKVAAPAAATQPKPVPQPSSLNPQPSTLNPNPSTINPNPSTINPNPSTLNPNPSTLNPQPSTPSPQPITPRTSTFRLSRFSLSGTKESIAQVQSVQSVQSASTTAITENKPIEPTELIIAWKEYAEKLPQEKIAMAQRMKAIEPTLLTAEGECEVLADNQVMLDEFSNLAPHIQSYLRRRLSNGSLHLQVRLSKPIERRRIYSRAEQLQMMMKENEALAKLQELLQLELQ